MKPSSDGGTKIEQDVQKLFSGKWEYYRIAMHDKGGLALASDYMSDRYSIRTLFDTLEMLDVYDSLKEQALAKQKNAGK